VDEAERERQGETVDIMGLNIIYQQVTRLPVPDEVEHYAREKEGLLVRVESIAERRTVGDALVAEGVCYATLRLQMWDIDGGRQFGRFAFSILAGRRDAELQAAVTDYRSAMQEALNTSTRSGRTAAQERVRDAIEAMKKVDSTCDAIWANWMASCGTPQCDCCFVELWLSKPDVELEHLVALRRVLSAFADPATAPVVHYSNWKPHLTEAR
jgi:hypothetical protein